MSEYNNNSSGRPPQGRGRDGRRRSGPNRGNNSNSNSGGNRGNFRPNRSKPPVQTGFQKFLSLVTFGILGKPKAPSQNHTPKPPQDREPRELGPIARGDREERNNTNTARRESRPPRPQPVSAEVTNERLYVGNLSYDATESDLFELFNGSGSVKNAEVVVNNRTQRSKGFAFVTMTSIDGAKKAVADLNGKDFMGRPLVVGGAKPMAPREERSNESQNDEDAITRPAEDEEEETSRAAV